MRSGTSVVVPFRFTFLFWEVRVMLRQLRVLLALVVVLGFAASLAQADLVSSGLIFNADAPADNNGSDGWTFTQLAVSGLPSNALQVAGTAATWTSTGGVQMFTTTGTSQSFAADSGRISSADTPNFTSRSGSSGTRISIRPDGKPDQRLGAEHADFSDDWCSLCPAQRRPGQAGLSRSHR